MVTRGLAIVGLLVACGGSDEVVLDARPGAVDAAQIDAPVDIVDASGVDAGADAMAAPGGFVPLQVSAELIASGPGRVTTPASWNAHLPKLAGDAQYLYAIHTHYPAATAERYAAIMRRAVATPGWTEVARVSYPHQPPGVVMDTGDRLHMVFDCLRPGGTPVTCFQGGAGTAGLTSRFYHLVFNARDGAGALRFDTYTNANEFTGESNGYHGLATGAYGYTVWALADTSWQRLVQYWGPGNTTGTIDTLSLTNGAYLLYPIIAPHPVAGSNALLLYMGEFDPGGGNNASYVASSVYSGDRAGVDHVLSRAPPSPPKPGSLAAFPSDVTYGNNGTAYALSYLPSGIVQCTELLRWDGPAATPTIVPIGCHSTYTKLQMASDGTLYVFRNGTGANLHIGVSIDRGDSFNWYDIPIVGLPDNGDVSYAGFAPVKQYTSPGIYDPDRIVFTFAGVDASGDAQHSYFGTVELR